MGSKTHATAAVLIPPEGAWDPIQAIRRIHDRQVRRWMPHVNLLYPFRPREDFEALAPLLEATARSVGTFEVTLAAFRSFAHGRRSHTVWLDPEPRERVAALQAALAAAVPDCDDLARFPGGFHPHLSVGQLRGDAKGLEEFIARLQAGWSPLRFEVREVFLIARSRPPDDVFRVERRVPLG